MKFMRVRSGENKNDESVGADFIFNWGWKSESFNNNWKEITRECINHLRTRLNRFSMRIHVGVQTRCGGVLTVTTIDKD